MAKKIKAIIVDTDKKTTYEIEIENTLNAFYKALKCNLIDIVERKIGGVWYDIIVDDEGLLNPDRYGKFSVVTFAKRNQMPIERIVGNVLITRSDTIGNTIGLEQMDIKRVLKNTARFADGQIGIVAEI